MTDYTTLDSGARTVFATGSQRDSEVGKPRPDLIPIAFRVAQTDNEHDLLSDSPRYLKLSFWHAVAVSDWLTAYTLFADSDHALRLGGLLYRGALKYDERNWELGQPMSRVYRSMCRHYAQWEAGETDEDHYAAVLFGLMALWMYESQPQFDGNTVVRDMVVVR